MKKSYLNQNGFTLAELVIVIVILTILTTIGFVTYQNYIPGTRDANRISQLTTIQNGLESYKARNLLPNPDRSIDISYGTGLITRQGYIGADILAALEYNKAGLDPKDKLAFTYIVSKNNKNFQLMGYLEEGATNIVYNNPLFKTTYAASDYKTRYPILFGKKLGVVLQDDTKIPAQDLATSIDLSTTSNGYIIYLSTDEVLTGSYFKMMPNLSCKRVMEAGGNNGNGVYILNPTGVNTFEAYCDMSTDGGGWTLVYKNINANSSFTFGSSFGLPNWHDNNNYGLQIDQWKFLSTSKVMAKIITFTGDQQTKITNGIILSDSPTISPSDSNSILDMSSLVGTKKYGIFIK